MFVRSLVVLSLSALTLGVGATTPGVVPPSSGADPHGHAQAQLAQLRAPDPMTPIYIVTAPATFKAGINHLATEAEPARDASGQWLVLARVRAHQLDDVSRLVHERERRCGGFFSFASRQQALRFLANDRTAQAMQAQAITYTIDNATTVVPWMAQVNEPRIRDTIHRLSTNWQNRYYASTQGQQAAQWLRSTWIGLANNRPDVSVDYVSCQGCGTQPSVVMTVRGTTKPSEIVVVGGHLDSISDSYANGVMQAPGADDDASGVATMTEVIRIALAQGWRPQRTVKFMAYAAEEVGLVGSASIAATHRAQNANVVGVLQLDMTNYAAGSALSMRLVTDRTNEALNKFVTDLFDRYLAPSGLTRGTTSCGYGCSDHSSWTSEGYPATFMVEPTLYPYRHTPDDNLANIGPTAAVSVNFAKLGLAFVGELAKTAPKLSNNFNGDGQSDIFWRNVSTGQNGIWRSANAGTGQAVTTAGPGWQAFAGDFNGDARADVLFRNAGSGANTIWLAANSATVQTVESEPDLGWRVAGVGDFDGDLRDDIFWRHASTGATKLWPAATRSRAVARATVSDKNWIVAGVGDFNKDGREDVLWHNTATGANQIWRSANSATTQTVTTTAAGWYVAGVGDFNRDGNDDILLRNSVNGQNVIWRSANSAMRQGVSAVTEMRYYVVQVADFDGDGFADILWRHSGTGDNIYWRAAQSTRAVTLGRVSDLNWRVVP